MKKYLILMFFLLVIMGVSRFNFYTNQKETFVEIVVEVKGEVELPGIYSLVQYSTINDVLKLAKPKEEADLNVLNLNQILKNRDVIVINKIANETKISINTATIEEWMTIPGIGEATAKTIVQYREEQGGFQSLEDLLNIKGIKEKKLKKMMPYIRL